MSTEFGVLCNLRSSDDSESPQRTLWMIPAQILEQYPFCANEKTKTNISKHLVGKNRNSYLEQNS